MRPCRPPGRFQILAGEQGGAFGLPCAAPAWQKKTPAIAGRGWVFGGPKEDRTPDLRIANAALSQLSYRPVKRAIIAAACGFGKGRRFISAVFPVVP